MCWSPSSMIVSACILFEYIIIDISGRFIAILNVIFVCDEHEMDGLIVATSYICNWFAFTEWFGWFFFLPVQMDVGTYVHHIFIKSRSTSLHLFAINPHHRNGRSSIKFTTFNQCLLVEIFVLQAKLLPSNFSPLFILISSPFPMEYSFVWQFTAAMPFLHDTLRKDMSNAHERFFSLVRIYIDVDRISTLWMSFPKYSIQVALRIDDLEIDTKKSQRCSSFLRFLPLSHRQIDSVTKLQLIFHL